MQDDFSQNWNITQAIHFLLSKSPSQPNGIAKTDFCIEGTETEKLGCYDFALKWCGSADCGLRSDGRKTFCCTPSVLCGSAQISQADWKSVSSILGEFVRSCRRELVFAG
eukprot:GHVP01067000.1.p1 GENE.GHVP01067000.1~~GHVP01067000.1.p1  ORF type:complete len:110 (-),score=6.93 GHVP01067000.1:337-666(-)